MKGKLLARVPVTWPAGVSRQDVADGVVDDLIEEAKEKRVPARWMADAERSWLSDRVLEVQLESVTVWMVLTDAEVSIFWDAPVHLRVLFSEQKRNALFAAIDISLDKRTRF